MSSVLSGLPTTTATPMTPQGFSVAIRVEVTRRSGLHLFWACCLACQQKEEAERQQPAAASSCMWLFVCTARSDRVPGRQEGRWSTILPWLHHSRLSHGLQTSRRAWDPPIGRPAAAAPLCQSCGWWRGGLPH